MPIDSSIYGQFAQPIRSPAEYAAQYDAADMRQLGLTKNRLDVQQQQAIMAQKEALRQAIQSGQINPMNQAHWAQGMAIAPDVFPGLADTVQKGLTAGASATKDLAQAGHYTAQTGQVNAQTVADDMKRLAAGVVANPTQDMARRAVIQLAAKHGGDPTQDLVEVSQLQTPDSVRAWALAHAGMADKLLPQTGMERAGGSIVPVQTNPLAGKVGPIAGAQQIPITQSADNAATNATSRANNSATIAAEDRRAAGQVEYQTDANGNLVAVPKRVMPGAAIAGQPVIGADGKQVPGKDSGLNSEQSNALTFASRMKAAHGILSDLEGKYSPTAVNTKTGLSGVYGVGGVLEAGANVLLTPEGQRADQAQRDFINAILRRESGAAISAGEYSNYGKEYFPQAGDKPAVIAQKRQARERAIQGLMQAVPQRYRGAVDNLAAPQKPKNIIVDW